MMPRMDDDDDTVTQGDSGEAAPVASGTPDTRVAPRRPERHPLRLLLVVVLTTAVVLAVIYQRVYKRRTALLNMQQAALGYARPAGQVVYEEEPSRAPALLAGAAGENPRYVAVPAGNAGGPPVAGHVPDVWPAMWRWAMPAGRGVPAGAVLFLHERQTVLGKRGLVCVQADRAARRLRVTFVHPGATTLDPVAVTDVAVEPRPQEGLMILTAGADPFAAKLPPADGDPAARADLRFFAGQPDTRDATHLTIGYEVAGRAGEISLWVQDERTVHYVNRTFTTGR